MAVLVQLGVVSIAEAVVLVTVVPTVVVVLVVLTVCLNPVLSVDFLLLSLKTLFQFQQ